VQSGETLSKLAARYYGDEYQWPRIQECNGWLTDPDQLKVGATICIPEPTQGASEGLSGFMSWFGTAGGGKEASASDGGEPPPQQVARRGKARTSNPAASTESESWTELFREALQVQCFGRPLGQLLLLIFGWFIVHMMVQGAFTWFAAHMAFVKDVSFKKAWHATVQSETLAALFVAVVGVAGLAVIYVATAPPGKPAIPELLAIAEQYLSTPTGTAVGGLAVVVLYAFLGIRFIPQALGTNGGQGVAVVLLSVLVPHIVLLYLVGYRLGYL
jgi:hypothetical protein